jgi:hypothetical protein
MNPCVLTPNGVNVHTKCKENVALIGYAMEALHLCWTYPVAKW